MSRSIERIIFLQGHEAGDALAIYSEHGAGAAFDHLIAWHYPGEHETSSEPSAGRDDTTHERDGYTLAVNTGLEYIGLEFEAEPVCQWFAGCQSKAVARTSHPTLGTVPTCARCHNFATQ